MGRYCLLGDVSEHYTPPLHHLTYPTAIYTVFIAYGAASIRLYIGEECVPPLPPFLPSPTNPTPPRMYQILLSDDTLVWPWEAFIRGIEMKIGNVRRRLVDDCPVTPIPA